MKRIVMKLIGGLLTLIVLATIIAFFPAPIEGNWLSSTVSCMCDSYNFLRFEDGMVLQISEAHPPPIWIGNYKKIGWGKYIMEGIFEGSPITVNAGLLTLRPFSFFAPGLRDLAFAKCNRILDDPQQEWIADFIRWNITIRTKEGETRYFLADRELPSAKLEGVLTALNSTNFLENSPLLIYTDTEPLPAELNRVITNLGIQYETEPNKRLHLMCRKRRDVDP